MVTNNFWTYPLKLCQYLCNVYNTFAISIYHLCSHVWVPCSFPHFLQNRHLEFPVFLWSVCVGKPRHLFIYSQAKACRILVPWPRNKLVPSAVEVQSPNHWTVRDFPAKAFFFFFSSTSLLLPTHLPPPSCTHAQSCNPMDLSLPDSSVHGFFQARILKWVAISFSSQGIFN